MDRPSAGGPPHRQRRSLELARYAKAIAAGVDLDAIVGEVNSRKARRDTLTAQLKALGDPRKVISLDTARINDRLHACFTDWQGLLPRHGPDARRLLSRLLRGRLIFEPDEDEKGKFYRFFGEGSISEMIRRVILPEGMVTPAGFEPAISTLKGSRPGPG